MIVPPTSSREFINNIMCNRAEGKTYYARACLDGTCSNCGGMSLLSQCIHESGDHEFGNMMIDMKSFKYVTYAVGPEKESKKIQLVTSQVSNYLYLFISIIFQYLIKYARTSFNYIDLSFFPSGTGQALHQ